MIYITAFVLLLPLGCSRFNPMHFILPHPQWDASTAHAVHFVFEWLAILVGAQCYRIIRKRQAQPLTQSISALAVVAGCVAGAAIGNKLVFLAEVPAVWGVYGWKSLLMGQSIVGGLLGGLLGVELAKKLAGVRHSTGDDFVLPLVVGTGIGRIGCYLAGLHDGTYGIATGGSWGVNLGDDVLRHPAPLYEIAFVCTAGALLHYHRAALSAVAGLRFKLYLSSYLLWRLCVEYLKPVPHEYSLGLSGIQWVCLVALVLYMPFVIRDIYRLRLRQTPTDTSSQPAEKHI